MSAFIVSKRHIDVLVESTRLAVGYPHYFILHWGKGQQFPGLIGDNALGRILWAENIKSVAACYPDDPDGNFRAQDVDAYWAAGAGLHLSPVQALKALDCYEYQSCEHEEWEASEVHDFCRVLRKRLITLLPGYEEAPWDW